MLDGADFLRVWEVIGSYRAPLRPSATPMPRADSTDWIPGHCWTAGLTGSLPSLPVPHCRHPPADAGTIPGHQPADAQPAQREADDAPQPLGQSTSLIARLEI
jgi:hypothetical protein